MNKLYNTTTKQVETLPDDQVEAAILQGTHSFAANDLVNIVDPDGKAHSLPATELNEAFKQGYKLENKQAAAVREYVEDNDGLGGAAKVALTSFVDQAAMGIPGLIAAKVQDPLEVAKREALAKEHSLTNTAFGVGGFAASLAIGAPLFKAAGVAGQAAERVVAKKLAAAGIEKGSQSIAKDILGRMAAKGAALGVEGAIISSPIALTEAALGDPEQAGETLLIGAGIGTALGFTGGLLAKPFEKLSATAKSVVGSAKEKLTGAIEKASVETGVPTAQMVPIASEELGLAGAVDALNVDSQTKGRIAKELGHKRADADDVAKAFETIGGTATDGALSTSKVVREAESSIVNDPTLVVGDKLRETYVKNFDAISKAASGALAETEERVLTKFQTGEDVKRSLVEKVKTASGEMGPMYAEYESFTAGIPVAEQSKKSIARNLLNDPDVRIASRTPQAALAKNAARDMQNIKTVADIKRLKSAYSVAPTASPQEKYMSGLIKEKLSNLEENTVRRFAEREMKTPQAKEKVLSILDLRKQADTKYRAFMEKFGELGGAIGKKRVRGAGDFVDFLEDISSEKLVDKLFAKNNVGFMDFFSKEFPEEFQAIVGQKKRQILEAATHDGIVSPAKIFAQVDKLPPEVQAMMLGEQANLFGAARKAFESMPTQINPSGTERFRAYREMLTPGGALKNAVAYSKLNASKNPDALLYIEKTMKHAAEKLDLIPAAIDSMGKGASKGSLASINAFSRLVDDGDKQAAFKKISKEISGAIANPTGMSDKVSKLSTPIQDGAPTIATQFSLKMTQALAYLDSQIPKPLSPQSPLIKRDFKPSDAELSAFERKLHTVLDPFSVVDDLKRGSLTRDQVDALRNVYPKIYNEIQRRIAHYITENEKNIPYQSRLKLSLIMGADFDPSLRPQAIQAYQTAFAVDEQAQAQAQAHDQKARASAKFNVAGRADPQGRVNKRT